MRKILGIVLLCVFALSFVGGLIVSEAKAMPPCTAGCIGGEWLICCPVGQSGRWECYWDGPC